jgi:putative tricarboxylic transport membrane protein
LSNSLGPGRDAPAPQTAPTRPWWVGIGVIAIGAVWLFGAASLPQSAQYARIGPGLVVTLVGIGLIVLGGIFLWQVARGETFAPQDAEDAVADAPPDMRALLTAAAAAGLPVVLMRPIGFPITAALSFALVARAFGSRRLLLDIIIGLVLSVVAYFGFIRLGVTLGGFLPFLGR